MRNSKTAATFSQPCVCDYQAFRRTPQEHVNFYRISLQPFDRFMEIFLFKMKLWVMLESEQNANEKQFDTLKW